MACTKFGGKIMIIIRPQIVPGTIERSSYLDFCKYLLEIIHVFRNVLLILSMNYIKKKRSHPRF
jgi:hypothetical protein